jgi:gamma-glutamyltranspeptidase/glutathione hydrolase
MGNHRRVVRRTVVAGLAVSGLAVPLALPGTASASGPSSGRHDNHAQQGRHSAAGTLPKVPVMTGSGGAVASVDRDASQVGIDVLARGGNAADAAVATAAALGVTEPFSSGIGGGGFLVYYDAHTHRVRTVDGRETAPRTFTPTTFTKADGTAMDFKTVVSSGLSVGVPGTPALWDVAARTFGTRRLSDLLEPAQRLATRGFTVDQTYHDQTAQNAERFAKFPATAKVFLRDGKAPAVGSVFRNPDMAKAYAELRRKGVDAIYRGQIGKDIVNESRAPHTASGVKVMGGQLTGKDLADYEALKKAPVHSTYKDLDVYGMPVPSSGGIAVAEILNLMRDYEQRTGLKTSEVSNTDYLHRFSEASATAFADRNRYVGDVPGVPVRELTSNGFAGERSCLFDPAKAQPRPIPFGSPDGSYTTCAQGATAQGQPREGLSTTHLVTADKWGNVASYTLTIEQTGGSGITVPGWGFLLNNELTDFDFVPLTKGVPDPNLPGPGKRPRSSMSPTVVLKDDRPWMTVGSPGGATIITSVAQTLLGYVDRGLSLEDAIAAPRLSSRNGKAEDAEPSLLGSSVGKALTAKGHVLAAPTAVPPEIGAVTAIRTYNRHAFQAAAEPVRRGGGSAMVVHPSQH